MKLTPSGRKRELSWVKEESYFLSSIAALLLFSKERKTIAVNDRATQKEISDHDLCESIESCGPGRKRNKRGTLLKSNGIHLDLPPVGGPSYALNVL